MTTSAIRISRITLLFISFLLLLIAAYPALAQDATTSSTTRKPIVPQRIETRKDLTQQRIETRKENIQDRITAMKERVATKEAALKQRLANFRDKAKALTAERINATLANINEKMTAQMSRHLEKMSQLLTKLEERVNANTPDIKDPTAVKEAIANAKDKIAFAQAAVDAQMEKDYVIVATSEATIRADAQAAKEQLHADLKALRLLVIDAKQAVSNAVRVAKSNAGGEKSSGQ